MEHIITPFLKLPEQVTAFQGGYDKVRRRLEKYKLEARRSLEDILEGARTGIWTIELEEGGFLKGFVRHAAAADIDFPQLRMLPGIDHLRAAVLQYFPHCFLNHLHIVRRNAIKPVHPRVNGASAVPGERRASGQQAGERKAYGGGGTL